MASGHYHRESVDDPQKCESFVPMQWLETVPIANVLYEIGLFGNQHTVCQPTAPKWRSTVDRLKQRFPCRCGPETRSASTEAGVLPCCRTVHPDALPLTLA